MKVLLTGAAGRLGRHCLAELNQAGWDVRATDCRAVEGQVPPIQVVDLLDAAAVAELGAECDAVVHLGNHPGPHRVAPERIFNENLAMNMNVFQAALDHGVRKLIFASSIQVNASEPVESVFARCGSGPAYLPLDGDLPAQPTNAYALSKWMGEVMLRDYFAAAGMDAVALRFPALLDSEMTVPYLARQAGTRQLVVPAPAHRIAQGFTVLLYADAARLIQALLEAPLPGYRVYLPAVSVPPPGSLPELLARYYSDVPLRRPLAARTDLCDCSRLQRETGWRPSATLDLAAPGPTVGGS